jgi:hypothetical protein
MLDLVHRGQLPGVVEDELDHHTAALTGYLYAEHDDAGAHTDITAHSAVVSGAVEAGSLKTDRIITPRRMVQSVDPATAPMLIIVDDAGTQLVGIHVPTTEVPGYEDRYPTLVADRFRLNGQGVYTPSVADTAALADTSDGPQYSVYRLTPSANRTIHGIYTGALVAGARGQVLVLINDSVYDITFGTGVVVNARKILGTPMVLSPQGSVLIVYDNAGLGWRIVASNGASSTGVGSAWSSYTPVWSASSVAPTLGNGTLTGAYTQIGKTCHFRISLTIGSTTALGTGDYTFSLPVTAVAPSTLVHVVGTWQANYIGVQFRLGVTRLASASACELFFDTATAPVGDNNPFIPGTGDEFGIEGTFEAA